MKKLFVFLTLFITTIITFTGCSSDPVSPENNTAEYGSVVFKIDRENAPENVHIVIAYLTRANYDTISSSMNFLSDSTADLTLSNIPVGGWHLKVNALDVNGQIIYSGETEVTILSNYTIQVTLTLHPVNQGVGNIYIFVTWGSIGPAGWTDFSGNPVMTTFQSPANPFALKDAKIIYDQGKYKLWYMAVFNAAAASIYYAESSDGKTWVHPQQQPVMTPTYGSWDSYGVGVGAVIKEDSLYRMFYSGWDYNDFEQVGMAVSTDGINWEKAPSPIIHPPQGYQKAAVSSALKANGKYFVFFGTSNYSQSINVSVSTDLINWVIHPSIITATQPWEMSRPAYASVIYENNQFKMVYQNANYTAFGEAVSSDGFQWEKKSINPVIKLNQVYNGWCTKIAYPNYFKHNDVFRIYYSGENALTGLDNLAFFQKN